MRRTNRSIAAEPLELRRMLSASVQLDKAHGTITITGTSGNDTLMFYASDDWGHRVIAYQADDVSGSVNNGTEAIFYNTINIYGLGGNDTINLRNCPIGMYINVYAGGAGSDTLNVGPDSPNLDHGGNWADIHFYSSGTSSTLNYRLASYPVKNRVQATVASDRVTLGDASSKQGIFFQGVSTINVLGSTSPYDVGVLSVAANQTVSVSGDNSYYWVGKPPYANYTYQVGNGDIAKTIRGKLFIEGGRGSNDKIIFDDSWSGGNIDTLSYNTFATFTMANPIKFTNTEQLTVFGSQNNDIINVLHSSGAKAININAAAGNDVIKIGGYGLDSVQGTTFNIDGFTGNDLVIANDAQHSGPTKYVIGAGKFQRDSNPAWNFAGLERFDLNTAWGNNFINGTAANLPLVINASGGSDTVFGSAFSDSIRGGSGNDYLYGAGGNDVIDGGAGADTMIGGAGIDLADYSSRTSGVTVGLNNPGGDGQPNENDNAASDIEAIAGGSGNDHLYLNLNVAGTLYGNAGNDTLVGSNKDDWLYGGAGDDLIKAGGGNDALVGGDGADRLSGGDGIDTIWSADAFRDTLDGGSGTTNFYKDNLDVLGVVS
jgi:Ca2+-binding RTX toxin-like protein